MMNCHEATRLMSEACERPLTRGERWSLKLHRCLCRGCRRFNRQLTVIRTAAQHPDRDKLSSGEHNNRQL